MSSPEDKISIVVAINVVRNICESSIFCLLVKLPVAIKPEQPWPRNWTMVSAVPWNQLTRGALGTCYERGGLSINPSPPIGTDFDLSAVPLYSLCTSTESNMQTPSRNRDSRRSQTRCGRVAAKWCAGERSQTGTQRSTSPKTYSAPTLQPQSTTNCPQVLAVRLPGHSSNRT